MSNQFSSTSVQQNVVDCCYVRPWGTVVSKANPPALAGLIAQRERQKGLVPVCTTREGCTLCVCMLFVHVVHVLMLCVLCICVVCACVCVSVLCRCVVYACVCVSVYVV